jgi:hypothetical protein
MAGASSHVGGLAKRAGPSCNEKQSANPYLRTRSHSGQDGKEERNSRAPNGTMPVLGEPKNPRLTPGRWPLTTPFSSGLRGALSQKGVEGVTPLILSVLRGCLWYAIALAISACGFLTPGLLAKSIIASALSLCAHASAFASNEDIPLRPASCTHGSGPGLRGPPLATHRVCQLCATCTGRSGRYISAG